MCNIVIFTALVSLSPSILRTRGTLRTLSNIYDEPFSTEPCVILVCSQLEDNHTPVKYLWWKILFRTMCNSRYLEPWHIQNSRHIQNAVKHLSWNIKKLVLPWHIQSLSIFATLVYSEIRAYSEPWRISKTRLFIGDLNYNCSRFRHLIYSKHIQNWSVSTINYFLMYQLFFRTANFLCHPLLFNKNMGFSLAILFFPATPLHMSYRALNSAPHCRYLTEFWMFYEWLTEVKIFVYSILKCNNITNNSKKQISGITTCSKLQILNEVWLSFVSKRILAVSKNKVQP